MVDARLQKTSGQVRSPALANLATPAATTEAKGFSQALLAQL